MNEDDFLLQEILFNSETPAQLELIRSELKQILEIVKNRDALRMKSYLEKIRNNIR